MTEIHVKHLVNLQKHHCIYGLCGKIGFFSISGFKVVHNSEQPVTCGQLSVMSALKPTANLTKGTLTSFFTSGRPKRNRVLGTWRLIDRCKCCDDSLSGVVSGSGAWTGLFKTCSLIWEAREPLSTVLAPALWSFWRDEHDSLCG